MNYDVNIREEIFGGNIYDLRSGKRYYVTNAELKEVLLNEKFPSDINMICTNKPKFIPLEVNDINIKHFSFADIAYIEVTRECNLRCKHCLNSSGDAMESQLTQEELIKIVNEFSESGIQEIRFTGGEPLLFKGIFDLINLASSLGIYTSIGTNGTLITKTTAKKLKEAGLKKAIVSIDGTKNKHDYIRGDGNYKKAMSGIYNLTKEGIVIRINSVILTSNIDDVIELAKKLHKKKTPLFIRRFIESGRGVELTNNMLTKKDYEYVKEKLKYELENGSYIDGHYLRNTDDETIHSRIELPFGVDDGCKAGQRALIITPDGEIHLCGFLAAQGFPSEGNVRLVNNWKTFWRTTQNKNSLCKLRNELSNYNKILGIQPTNCLAYVQRSIDLNIQKK